MNKVLITGGSGFLGRYIIREFLQQGWKVTSIDHVRIENITGVESIIRTLPTSDFSDIVQRIQPDVLVHTAGTSSVQNSIVQPYTDFSINVDLTARLLEDLHRYYPTCKIIYLSSAAVYGNPKRLPIKESDSINPISPYGFNKYFCELLIKEYYRIFGIQGCCVRIFSAYGSGLRKQLLWDICTKITKEHEVKLMGTGFESRDMIHAKDVARAILLLASKAVFQGEVFNLATGIQTTTRSIAEKLINNFGGNILLDFSGEVRIGDPLYWHADIDRISTLGFTPETSMDQGLQEYSDWFKKL